MTTPTHTPGPWGVSPLTIMIMLECYGSAEPGSGQNMPFRIWASSAGQEARAVLKDNGLIGDNHRPTELGHMWVSAICSIPLPALSKALGEDGQ